MTRTGHNRWLGSVMGRVTINGTIAQFSCKQSVSKILVLIRKICFEITHLLNMSYKLGHLSRIFAVEINRYDFKQY